MSRIEFATRSKEAYISGTERAYAGILLAEITNSILMPRMNRELLLTAIPSSRYLATSDENNIMWAESFRTTFAYESELMIVDGNIIDSFDLFLNTALSVGNDALKMLAAVHGQCEVNAFVRGKNRAWMADIIANDNAGLFRPNKGWEEVIDLLRESDDETVFMSYSVTDDILRNVRRVWLQKTVEERGLEITDYNTFAALEQEWQAFGEDKHWELVDAWVEERSTQGFELSPERWASDFTFGDGMNAGKLMAILEQARK